MQSTRLRTTPNVIEGALLRTHPKLAVTTVNGEGFAAQLEAARKRSPKLADNARLLFPVLQDGAPALVLVD